MDESQNPNSIRKHAESLWEKANNIGGEEEKKLRLQAIEVLEKAILLYVKQEKVIEQLITESRREKWLGIIADHDAKFSEALNHYQNALNIEQSIGTYPRKEISISYLNGLVEECKAKLLILENSVFGNLPYDKIIAHFEKAKKKYADAKELNPSNYCKGFSLLLSYLMEDDYVKFKEYVKFREKMNIDILNYNPGSARGELKKYHFIDKIKPYYEQAIFRYFWSKGKNLERNLSLIRKQMYDDKVDFDTYPRWSPQSLHNSMRKIENKLKIKSPDLIHELYFINQNYKHGNESEEETRLLEEKVISLESYLCKEDIEKEIKNYLKTVISEIKKKYKYEIKYDDFVSKITV